MGNEASVATRKTNQVQQNKAGRKGDLNSILDDLRRKQTKPRITLLVDRSNVLQSSLPHIKQPECELHPLEIKFTSAGVEENVLNLGGPSREFFSLLLTKFKRSKLDMFEGKGGFLLPVNNQKAIDAQMFFYFGKALVLSNIHSGPGFPHFPKYIISFLRGEEFLHELATQLVINTMLVNYINEICNAKNQNELDQIISNDDERFLDNCGWPRTDRIKMDNKIFYVQTLLKWDLFDKRERALEQLKSGMNTLRFLDNACALEEFESLYLCRDKRSTTAAFIREQLIPEVKKLEVEAKDEEKAKKFTLNCLQMLEDKEAAHLFQFITGLDDVPVTEFNLKVEFNRTNRKSTLPEAITCVERLIIPLGNKSQLEYYSSFEKALRLGRLGFSESS